MSSFRYRFGKTLTQLSSSSHDLEFIWVQDSYSGRIAFFFFSHIMIKKKKKKATSHNNYAKVLSFFELDLILKNQSLRLGKCNAVAHLSLG